MLESALFSLGIAFFIMGLFAFGKGKPDAAGVVFFFSGLFASLVAWHIGLVSGDVFTGTLVAIFGFTWLAGGIMCISGYDLVALGNVTAFNGVMVALYSGWFFLNGLITLGSCCALWVLAFWSVTGFTYGKIPARIVGYIFSIEAFITLLIPAWLLLAGITLP